MFFHLGNIGCLESRNYIRIYQANLMADGINVGKVLV